MEEEVILNQIIEDAKREADLIIANAEETAKKIEEENRDKAAKQAENQFEIIKAKIETNAMADLEKAEFEARSTKLIEKKKIIEIVKEKVKQKIKDLNENDYIDIINEKIKRYKDEKDVEILLPKKCYEQIKRLAIGYGMNVLDITDDFDLGVIVKCGKIE